MNIIYISAAYDNTQDVPPATLIAQCTCRADYRRDKFAAVRFRTVDGTAKQGLDYEATSGVLEFPADSSSATIAVPILATDDLERDESFAVELYDPRPVEAIELQRSTVRIRMIPCVL